MGKNHGLIGRSIIGRRSAAASVSLGPGFRENSEEG